MKKFTFLLIFLMLLLLPSTLYARSLDIDTYNISYNLNEDGVINVSEKIVYSLDGCFTELYLQKPTNLKIINADGFCENKECSFRHDKTGTPTGDQELVLKSSYCDESVVVNFSYDVVNVINQLQDGYQFYYFLYGKDTLYSTDLTIFLKVPGDFKDTKYFIHSKDYNLSISENTMVISKTVIPKEPIEINLLMPEDWFENTENINIDARSMSQIIELEKDWEKDYNRYMSKITVYPKQTQRIIMILFILIPVLFLFFVWYKYGREVSRKELNYFNDYYREVPFKDHDPLLANYYLSEKFSKNWFSSGIMYLVWKGIYNLEKEGKDYFLEKTSKELEVKGYILDIYSFFEKHFKEEKFNVKEIQNRLNNKISFGKNIIDQMKINSSFKKDFIELYKKTKKDYDKLFLDNKEDYEKKGRVIAGYFLLIYSGLFFITSLIFVNKIPSIFLLFIGYLIVTVILFSIFGEPFFGRFTKKGRLKNLRWKGFKKYITDFSDIKNHPPKHVILWEEFLVYATAFGVAKKVTKNIKTLMPQEYSQNTRIAVYSSFIVSKQFSDIGKISSGGASSGSGGGFGGGAGGGGAGGR